MSLTLQLSPELEAKLREQAALVGKQPERIALDAIEESLNSSTEQPPRLSKEEWHRRFDALIASMSPGNLNADLSRDSAYDDRSL